MDIDAFMREQTASWDDSNKIVQDGFIEYMLSTGMLVMWEVFLQGAISGVSNAIGKANERET